jgi:hypothetical protein
LITAQRGTLTFPATSAVFRRIRSRSICTRTEEEGIIAIETAIRIFVKFTARQLLTIAGVE